MSNKIKECIDCPYNLPKTKGGYGRLCNGLTQEKYGRCPEWRITEVIQATNEPYNKNRRYHSIRD